VRAQDRRSWDAGSLLLGSRPTPNIRAGLLRAEAADVACSSRDVALLIPMLAF